MVPTPFTERRFSPDNRRCLLEIASASIQSGLESGKPISPKPDTYAQELQEHAASFVTLHIEKGLRGCIGNLEASRPLVNDVADNAFAAAFRDPRFSPLERSEFAHIHIHVSILSPATPLEFESETDLIAQLRPGHDGLILKAGEQHGTFLPSVWDTIREPSIFLGQLKIKAGLAEDFWSDELRVWRYTTESFSPDQAI